MAVTDGSSGHTKLLSERDILDELSEPLRAAATVHTHTTIESTNSCLMASSEPCQLVICAAESQTAGRGRRGKNWVTPAAGVTFSMRLTLPVAVSRISGGSLVVGVAVCEALRSLGVAQATVKWPNDILVGNAKLAGILVEIAAHTKVSTSVVIGIGLNYRTGHERHQLERAVIDLDTLFEGDLPDRSKLIGNICGRVYTSINAGLPLSADFVSRWKDYDALVNREVDVIVGRENETISGRVAGIDKVGRLALQTDDGIQYFSSAEISIKGLSSTAE